MSDGCINKRQLIVSIHENDELHLRKLASLLNTKIGRSTTTNLWHKIPYTMVRICCENKYFIQKWRRLFNLTGAKTYNPPDLDIFYTYEKFLPFLIGFIDGDGHVANKTNNIRIKEHGSWLVILKQFVECLKNFYDIDARAYLDKENFSTLHITSLRSKFVPLMSPLNLPTMERKWNFF